MLGVSFAGTWEIGTSSTVVWEFGTLKSLTGVGGLLVGTALADVCRIGIETPLGDLRVRTSIADVWMIGALISLASSWSGIEGTTAWHVIGTKRPSPFVNDTELPDNAITYALSVIAYIGL